MKDLFSSTSIIDFKILNYSRRNLADNEGSFLSPSLYAPVHQHFFVARMDMAVDCKPGEALNQVVEVNVKVEDQGDHNVHNNAFLAEETVLGSDLQAMRDCNPLSTWHWMELLELGERIGHVNTGLGDA